MIYYILLFLSLILGVTKNIIPKSGKKDFSGFDNLMSVNIITAIVGIIIFALGGMDFNMLKGIPFITLAFLYGLCTLGSQSLYMVATQTGSVSVCSLVYAACFIIPTVFTAVCYNEKFSAFRIIGIAVMLLSVILVSIKGEKNANSSKKYLIFAFMAMICAGSVGIMQKAFSHIYSGMGINEYLFLAFLFMLVFSVVGKAIVRLKTNSSQKHKMNFYILAFALSLSVVIANKLNMFLVGVLPGLIFFPVINGGTIMFSTLVSKYLFKEQLSFLSWCGIIMGILAIVLIAL